VNVRHRLGCRSLVHVSRFRSPVTNGGTGVLLRYRFRVYPTAPQRAALARTFGCVRTVYNDAVAARRAAYREGLPFPRTADLDKLLITTAKRTPERAWLADVSAVPLQQSLRDCHIAYKNFFDSRNGQRVGARMGPPRFKRRSGRQTARFTRSGFSLCSGCGALTGPQGLEGLRVRDWTCACGAIHDRDVNAEINIRREGRRLAQVAAGQSET
jgi:transposase